MNQADLQALRNPLLVLAIVAVLGALAVYYSGRLMVAARQQLAQQQVQLKEARTRLQRSGDEKDIIVRYIDGFRQLERAGFVGEEQRINWLDGLRLANQQSDLFGVDYQIGTQRPYAFASEFVPGPLALNQSVMRVRFRLLHEGDLERFFDSLARQGTGIFTVDQCMLRRIDNRGVIRYQPNINADCELSWITVRTGPGREQKKP
jgi:hypothetical protein